MDLATNRVIAAVPVGTDPFEAAFDGADVWVADVTGVDVSKIDPATDSVALTVPVGLVPRGGLRRHPPGVAGRSAHEVWRILPN